MFSIINSSYLLQKLNLLLESPKMGEKNWLQVNKTLERFKHLQMKLLFNNNFYEWQSNRGNSKVAKIILLKGCSMVWLMALTVPLLCYGFTGGQQWRREVPCGVCLLMAQMCSFVKWRVQNTGCFFLKRNLVLGNKIYGINSAI